MEREEGINKAWRERGRRKGGQGRDPGESPVPAQQALPLFCPGAEAVLASLLLLTTTTTTIPLVWSGQSRSDSRQSVTGRRTGTTFNRFPRHSPTFPDPLRFFTRPDGHELHPRPTFFPSFLPSFQVSPSLVNLSRK